MRRYSRAEGAATQPQPRSILSKSVVPDFSTRITLTEPGSRVAVTLEEDTSALVTRRLQEALADADERGAQQLKFDKIFVQAIMSTMEYRSKTYADLKTKFDGMKVNFRWFCVNCCDLMTIS
jgi:hypothetical protein